MTWHKSRRSAASGNCVEVARLPGWGIAVRDSKDRGGVPLVFGTRAWAAFVAEVKGGRFDR
ncbi:DUF397 domain-containing protein [Streptosporangium sp. NPDC023615]|uniref:DUF397 domain-containing protein n=1 Tax=Streptosporangium sp. NPDC023615 TaxID=3154794 RepID=UPI00342A7C2E